jgi:group I intron endonuclease
MKFGGIYWIKNLANHCIYIGSAVNFEKRFKDHKAGLKKGKHSNYHLQNAWNKHGEENFVFEPLEKVKDKNNLIKREQYFIDNLAPEYNICKVAGSLLGVKHSKKTIEKIAKLTWEQVDEIRKLYLTKKYTQENLANQYGVTRGSIKAVLRNLSFRDKNYTPLEKFSNKRKISMKEAQIIRKLYKEGKTQKELAEKYNVVRGTVKGIVQNTIYCDENYKIDENRKRKNVKLSKEQASEIRTLYSSGYTQEKLAQKYSVARGSIIKIVHNITFKDKDYIVSDKKPFVIKLNYELAEKIRKCYKNEKTSYAKLAKKFNVCRSLIQAIVENRRWKQEQ